MRFAFHARLEAASHTGEHCTAEVFYITLLQQFASPVPRRVSSALAVDTRLTRDIRGTTSAWPPRKVPTLLEVGLVRPSTTAGVVSSAVPVAHRKGTPQTSGTQSQGLRIRRTPGCRIEPPEGFLSRPEPIREEVCHAGSIHART